MTLFTLKSETTVPVVESYLELLAASQYDQIQLPAKHIKAAGLGGESALMQFLITWARRNPGGEVVAPVELGDPETEEHTLKHLASRAYSFTALLAASDVVAADQSTSIRARTNRACSMRVDAMAESLQKAAFGHRTFLACVDHSTKGNIPAFYFSDGTLRTRTEFADLAEELLLSRAASYTKRQISSSTRNGLGLILYELLKNTHDWGRTDLDNVPLRPSLRGLLFTRFNVLLAGAITSAGGNPLLESYVQHLGEHSRDDYVRFLELSIFDGGPGLAARWLNRPQTDDLALAKELEACLACLAKHKTTSGASTRGLGLYDVMNTLNELQAYIRVRTGRLALCRNFVASPLQSKEQLSGPELFDWTTESTTPTPMARTEGTLITIVIPLLEEND